MHVRYTRNGTDTLYSAEMDLSIFAAVFCALGLRLLFGGYSVGLGTVVLLGAVSAAGTIAIESFVCGKEPPRIDNISVEESVEVAKTVWGTVGETVWRALHRN